MPTLSYSIDLIDNESQRHTISLDFHLLDIHIYFFVKYILYTKHVWCIV